MTWLCENSWGKLLLALLTATFLLAGGPGRGFTATEDREPGAPASDEKQDIQEIGKQLNNPVSSIWNITTQSNLTFFKGNLSPSYRGQFTFNFQPVLPIPLTKDWNLIPRPVIPFLSTPYIRGGEYQYRDARLEPHRRHGGYGFCHLSLTQPP